MTQADLSNYVRTILKSLPLDALEARLALSLLNGEVMRSLPDVNRSAKREFDAAVGRGESWVAR